MLDVQYVRSDEQVYDDTGWTLGYLKNLDFKRIANPAVLKVAMHEWTGPAPLPPITYGTWAVVNSADIDFARFAFALKNSHIKITEAEATVDGKKLPAGTMLIDIPSGNDDALRAVHAALGRTRIQPIGNPPDVRAHEIHLPRIAILHTWLRTQDEGWFRLGLESMGIPYSYLSTQDVSKMPNLREKFDVILFAPTGGANSASEIVNGLPPGPPLPWRKTELTPNLGGIDETDDMRPGLGLTGVENLSRFVEDGGLLITARDTSTWAVQYGLARWIRVVEPQKLRAPGTILLASITDKKSPITAGYDDTLPIYYASTPIFRVGLTQQPGAESRPSGRGGKNDPDVPQGRPFVPLPERPKPAPGDEGFQPAKDAPWNSD
ncbi:MAG: M14 family zinc carboxypeptidase, partial [Thermoanaerobaculia bacterium]